MKWADESVYMGQWREGIQHGLGIMMYYVEERKLKKRAGFFTDNMFSKPLIKMQ